MANTNAYSKFFVCPIPQNRNLTEDDYNSLEWVLVGGLGNFGETGKSTNILTYNTWETEVSDKAKGITDAGSPTVEIARDPFDAGQEILRQAGAVGNNNKYAFKMQRSDGPLGGTGTVIYNRGLVGGPTRPNGQNEDFDLEVFTLGLVQEEIVVAPTTGSDIPVLTAAPVLSGTVESGETLTCTQGTFTGDSIQYSYQWFANGVSIIGETNSSYTVKASDTDKIFQCRVTAKNTGGYAYGFSNTLTA